MWTKRFLFFLIFSFLTALVINHKTLAESNLQPDSSGVWFLEKLDGKVPVIGGLYLKQKLSITFHRDGKFSGYGGCNSIFGKYIINKSSKTIQITSLGSTERGCKVLQQESRYMKMIQNAVRYEINGEQLILITTKDKKLIFRFKKKH